LHLTSYSGANSFLMDVLPSLYIDNGEGKLDYQLYNTLAISYGQSKASGVLDKNFRIIRSDLVAEFAEKYMIGFAPEVA